ncbi:MAG: site-2 protease family protein [Anaerolineales bacterium]|nr:site-2 protease family protein [Anaerolineales bacterium]MCB8968437.1 site-2 protease family protein [Ardenticatenaceae bacterium]
MFGENVLWAIGGFLIVLTPIVLVHELGHFWAARLANIRVEEFGFGIPPRAAVLAKRKGTLFTLNWIPLGGFVRPAGEDDPSIPDGLAAASKRARFFVLVAGAGANFVMALFIWWIAYMIGPPAVAVTSVRPDSPAMEAGLQVGDVFLTVDGVSADNSRVIADPMYSKGGQPVDLVVKRGDEVLNLVVVPRKSGEYDAVQEGPLGVGLGFSTNGDRVQRAFLPALGDSLDSIWDYVTLFVRVPTMLIRGEISPSEARPVSVVGISQMAGQMVEVSAASSNLFPLLNITAFISVALGLTNLLPIPALDGGRILFVLIEAVRGRRIEPEREGMVHVVGMLFMLVLMVLMIVQDIVNPIIPLN